jgi:uncharacterized Zn-finger protein
MNTFYLEAVNCKHCQRLCYFRQASFAWPEDDPRWSESDTPPPVVACGECKHVYDYQDQKPKTVPSPEGLAPASPHASMRVFEVPIECDRPCCPTPLLVIAVRNRNTSTEALQAEASAWTWENLTCPSEDPVSPRTLRLEALVSLKCLNPDCDASFDYPRDWFRVGKRIECPFCQKRFILTAEILEGLDQ